MLFDMKPVSTGSFYGKRKSLCEGKDGVEYPAKLDPKAPKRTLWEQKLKRIEDLVRSLKDNPLPIKRKERISDPVSVYRIFPKQQQAFDFSETCEQDVTIFSKELTSDGRRNYLVTTSREFWKMYKTLPSEKRCYYEVIQEGSPCRLYFDLEFKKELNPNHDGEQMVEIFIKYVCQELLKNFKIMCDKSNVIYMDSSTENKFSAHLVFHLPNMVFKDNIHAGRFVEYVCTSIHSILKAFRSNESESNKTARDDDWLTAVGRTSKCSIGGIGNREEDSFVKEQDLQKLLVMNSKGDQDIFCDRGVYTKNRNFRLYLSTKVEKNAPLVLARQNAFKPSTTKKTSYDSHDSEYCLFMDSLVSNFRLQPQWEILTLDAQPCADHFKKPRERRSCDSVAMGRESPYPEVDRFIKDNISEGGVQGYIRRCFFFKEGNMIIYDIGDNRWCENIGRPHKSNHIMMVADLDLGVYYQKCHDPECRKIDFRSQEKPFPFDVKLRKPNCIEDVIIKSLDEAIDDDFLMTVDQLEEQACSQTSEETLI